MCITAGVPRAHVVVIAAGDILDRVTTEVRDRELVIAMKPGTNELRSDSPHIEIALPVLRGVSNEGSGSVKIAGIDGGDLAIGNSGAASFLAGGRAQTLSIVLDRVGQIDTTQLAARDVTVDNNGVGSVRVRAGGHLVLAVNGVGAIRYTGNPTQIERHVNGIGSIEPL
jgi:hypothetical protein